MGLERRRPDNDAPRAEKDGEDSLFCGANCVAACSGGWHPDPMSQSGELADGTAALAEGRWAAAVRAFEKVLAEGRDPEALDGLGRALWWEGRTREAIELRKEAYALLRRRGDSARSIRIAVWLSQEYAAEGNEVVARGWLARAERMCSKLQAEPERGWLALARTDRVTDPSAMAAHAREALDLARKYDEPDLEIRALARLGLAVLSSGRVDEGLDLLSEAMAAATGGEATALDVLAETCCDMFRAKNVASDDAGFKQWNPVLRDFLARTQHVQGVAFCGACCGELHVAAGNLQVAEAHLTKALQDLEAQGQRARCVHPAAKLADIRVMQGRYEEAHRLLEGYEGLPEAARPRVALAMARGEFGTAIALLERRLRAIGEDSLLSLPYLALLVEALVAKGNLEGARDGAARLESLARATGHPRVQAEAYRAIGRVAAAEGDETRARSALEAALEAFGRLARPIDEAQTRVLLAQAVVKSEPELAADEARAALAAFERLACPRDADAAASLLRAISGAGRAGPKAFGMLSRREQEVLQLMSEGLKNAEIAARLYISTKTAGHHVSNILMKTGLKSRVEAAAWALRLTAVSAQK
jgi:DNA-binding NarL/FixJ family response regulator